MLNYIPETLYTEAGVNPARVFNNKVITQPAACVITRNFRFEDNFVLKFAQNNEHIVIFLKPVFEIKGKQEFFDRNFNLILKNLKITVFLLLKQKLMILLQIIKSKP